jgi:hypothetical protein
MQAVSVAGNGLDRSVFFIMQMQVIDLNLQQPKMILGKCVEIAADGTVKTVPLYN